MSTSTLSNDALSDYQQATPFWLTKVLREHGTLDQNQSVSKVTYTELRSPDTVNSVSRSRVNIRYNGDYGSDKPTSLFLKIARSDPQIVKRSLMEIDFYTRSAKLSKKLPIADCYHTAHSEKKLCNHILIQDFSASHYGPNSILPYKLDDEKRLVDSLAKVHAAFWRNNEFTDIEAGLPTPEHIKQRSTETSKALAKITDFLGDRMSAKKLAVFELILSRYESTMQKHDQIYPFKCKDKPYTLTHGDAHRDNFLLPKKPQRDSVQIIDWQTWRIWSGTDDLAFPISLDWYPERRRLYEVELLKHYHHELQKSGVNDYDWETCWLDYRISIIKVIILPLLQWALGQPTEFWWHRFEVAGIAFDDLDCQELLV